MSDYTAEEFAAWKAWFQKYGTQEMGGVEALRNLAAAKSLLEKSIQSELALTSKLRDYETWFRANAALLATHRIGGYCFEPSPNATKVDPVHGTIIRAETTGNPDL